MMSYFQNPMGGFLGRQRKTFQIMTHPSTFITSQLADLEPIRSNLSYFRVPVLLDLVGKNKKQLINSFFTPQGIIVQYKRSVMFTEISCTVAYW